MNAAQMLHGCCMDVDVHWQSDCACRCNGQWSGGDCSSCSIQCANGGTLDTSACSCSCAPGYFGATCQNYVLGRWHSRSGINAEIEFCWKLADYMPASHFDRFAEAPGTRNNPMIGGTRVPISAAEGSVTVQIRLNQYIPFRPKAFFYSLTKSLGTNEFGVARGSELVNIPAFFWDQVLFFTLFFCPLEWTRSTRNARQRNAAQRASAHLGIRLAAGKRIVSWPLLCCFVTGGHWQVDDCLKGGNEPVVSGLPLCAGTYTATPSQLALPAIPTEPTGSTLLPEKSPTIELPSPSADKSGRKSKKSAKSEESAKTGKSKRFDKSGSNQTSENEGRRTQRRRQAVAQPLAHENNEKKAQLTAQWTDLLVGAIVVVIAICAISYYQHRKRRALSEQEQDGDGASLYRRLAAQQQALAPQPDEQGKFETAQPHVVL